MDSTSWRLESVNLEENVKIGKPALITANPGPLVLLRAADGRVAKVLVEHGDEEGHQDEQCQNGDGQTGGLDDGVFAAFILFTLLCKLIYKFIFNFVFTFSMVNSGVEQVHLEVGHVGTAIPGLKRWSMK